jgi:hypothetical protein
MKKVNHIGIVLDRSGSMASVREEALSGLNEELACLEKKAVETNQKTTITLTTFSTKADEAKVISLGERVSEEEYKCSGWTALSDSVASTIKALQEIKVGKSEDVAYLVTIVTDGEENSSKEYSMRDVSVMIKTLQNQGNWTFVFMGCGNNVFDVAKSMGITYGNTSTITTSDYTGSATGGKISGYDKFYKVRGVGGQSIRNFSSNE